MPDVLSGILDQARTGPHRVAVKDLDRQLSYAELCDEAARLGSGLTARGVVEGDRIALLLPNSVDFVVAAVASLWVGAIFVPLAVTDPEARLTAIVADCTPVVVITSDAQSPRTLGTSPLVPISALRAGEHHAPASTDRRPAVAYLIYTSGTTGMPKGVMISPAAFGAAVDATSRALGLDASTRTLCVSPFYFDGSFGTLFPTLVSGGLVVLRPRDSLLFLRAFFKAVVAERITYTGFSPSYLRLLLTSPQMALLGESSLDVIALGGEASSIADIRALWAFAPKVRVFNRYGPTETTIAVTHVQLTAAMTADGAVPLGYPHDDVTFTIVSSDGTIINAADHIGELHIGGAQLMIGYWGAPALTAEVLRTDIVPGETVYRTGDLVYRDRDGRYVYVDRTDRVIKRSGVRISLVEVSEAMRGLAGVTAAACMTFDDAGDLGIVAFVVTDRPVAALDLKQAAGERLPETMLPNVVVAVEALPLTTSGKLDERLLLSDAGLQPPDAGLQPPPAPAPAPKR